MEYYFLLLLMYGMTELYISLIWCFLCIEYLRGVVMLCFFIFTLLLNLDTSNSPRAKRETLAMFCYTRFSKKTKRVGLM